MNFTDMIVVIPGIMGSQLVDRHGKELWGASLGSAINTILHLGKQYQAIRLPDGIGDSHPNDGVTAPALLPVARSLGKLFGADGYETLIQYLQQRLGVRLTTPQQAGNLLSFPYDWRLSNRYTAQQLRDIAIPALERWRKESNNPQAKLVLIAHSMGGLVARWFLEKLGGAEVTSKLITIATPYRGSLEALLRLSNGFNPRFGPIQVPLTDIVRSLPSAHQLLPTYQCMDVGKDGAVRMKDTLDTLPNLNRPMVQDALDFHYDMHQAVKGNPQPAYRTFALKGIAQPTHWIAREAQGVLEGLKQYNGDDFGGDGTVPRISSHPTDWPDDASAAVFGQQHATLQSDEHVLRQIYGILTAERVQQYADAGISLGIEAPDMILAGEKLQIHAISTIGDETLPLQATITDETGKRIESTIFRNNGNGNYEVAFAPLVPGLLTITVDSAIPQKPLHPIRTQTLVWNATEIYV
jgi:pimeloyl-ACP methyl ester carboxylesterase